MKGEKRPQEAAPASPGATKGGGSILRAFPREASQAGTCYKGEREGGEGCDGPQLHPAPAHSSVFPFLTKLNFAHPSNAPSI